MLRKELGKKALDLDLSEVGGILLVVAFSCLSFLFLHFPLHLT